MKITCPACAAKYSIADEKVQDRLAKIRCRKCGTTIVIDGRNSPAQVYAADGSAAAQPAASMAPSPEPTASGTEYSVDFGEGDQRNMTMSEIVDAYNTGVVTADTYVWADGMSDWTPLGEVSDIVDALHAAAAGSAEAPAPAATPGSSPWNQSAAAPAAGRAAVAGAASAVRTDLFGGYASAGSEEDVTTSLPQETPAPAQAQTGARNESSVLFSLSALTASTGSSPAPAVGGAMDIASIGTSRDAGEDSGLIDLAALTAQSSGGGAAAHGADDSGMFGAPLGIASPLGAPVAPPVAAPAFDAGPLEYPKNSNKTAIIIGGSILAAAVVIVGAMFAFKEEPQPVVQQPLIAAPAPTPTAEPEPTATSTAAPPTTGVAEDEKPDAGAKVAKKRAVYRKTTKSTSNSSSSSSQSSNSSSSGSTTTPSKPKTKCGCPPGDLKCAMRCAAKGG